MKYNLTLTQVRSFMRMADVPTLAMEPDQVAAARRIVGRTNSTEPYLSNMIQALSLFYHRNTAEEWQRLEAAIIVRAHRGARRVA